MDFRLRSLVWGAGFLLIAGAAWIGFTATRLETDDVAMIEREVAEIRGRPFKHPVALRYLTHEEALADVQAQAASREPFPPDYGKVVRALGLYRGPEIADVDAMRLGLVAARSVRGLGFYDVDRKAMFIERGAPEWQLADLYPHEIYHGFQDQYFDLGNYYAHRFGDDSLNGDALLARRAAIEGEATYIQLLWKAKRAAKRPPTRQMLEGVIREAAAAEFDALGATLKRPDLSDLSRRRIEEMLEASRGVPAFASELYDAAYRKGLVFIYSVQERGWGEVEKLYGEYPPASSEQILHPKKWFARESPVEIAWPTFQDNPLFADWQLLKQDVLGELQWRLVFRENGLASEAAQLAEGWGGDRFAVFANPRTGKLLMLMYTIWDTEPDALEFAQGYRRVLETKYSSEPTPRRLVREGRRVLIVEGGEETSLTPLIAFVDEATWKEPVRVVPRP